jgi:hypothetical protein
VSRRKHSKNTVTDLPAAGGVSVASPAPAVASGTAADAPSTTAGSATAFWDATPAPDVRKRFLAVAVLAGLWIASLAILALATANPVTLNREQILHAPYLVTAKVISRRDGLVSVSREWKHGAGLPNDKDTVKLENLEDAGVREGVEYVFPVRKRPDGTLVVYETRLPNGRPLAYPATDAALKAIEALLAEAKAGRASP